VKFDIGAEPPPPPTAAEAIMMSVSAKGICRMARQPVSRVIPEQASRRVHVCAAIALYFLRERQFRNSARYSRQGATGFSEMNLEGKMRSMRTMIIGMLSASRMKQNPDMKLRSPARTRIPESSVIRSNFPKHAQWLFVIIFNTWVLTETVSLLTSVSAWLPTNPVTKQVWKKIVASKFSSNDPRIIDPVKIENKKSESVGETQIRYETT